MKAYLPIFTIIVVIIGAGFLISLYGVTRPAQQVEEPITIQVVATESEPAPDPIVEPLAIIKTPFFQIDLIDANMVTVGQGVYFFVDSMSCLYLREQLSCVPLATKPTDPTPAPESEDGPPTMWDENWYTQEST